MSTVQSRYRSEAELPILEEIYSKIDTGITETRHHVQPGSSGNLVTEPTCNYTSVKGILLGKLMLRRSGFLVKNLHGHNTLVETFCSMPIGPVKKEVHDALIKQ